MRLNNRSAKGEKEVRGRIPLLLAIDEFPTLRLNNAERIPAVGRSRKIITCFAFQDLSQLQEQYGTQSARTIIANLATQFWGMASGLDTANYINRLFGKRLVKKVSQSQGRSQNHSHIPLLSTKHHRSNSRSQNRSTSKSEQWEDALPIHEVAEMEVGEFAALLPYNNPVHQRKRLVYEKEESAAIPDVSSIDNLQAHYDEIRAEAQNIVMKYADRVETVFVEKGRVGEFRGVGK